jgi:hypothetical protein
MPDDAFENPHAQLGEWVARQGFAIDSFTGERDAVKLSLEEAPNGDAGMLPTKEKLTHRHTGAACPGGAQKLFGAARKTCPNVNGVRTHGTGPSSCK